MTEPVNPDTRFERKDIDIRPLLSIAGGLVVVVVIVCLVSWWVFDLLQARDRATKVSPFPLAAEERKQLEGRRQLPAEPHLEQIDRMEAAAGHQLPTRLYNTELERLKSYGWVDEEKKIVHIPIEQAMNMIVEQEAKKADKRNGGQP